VSETELILLSLLHWILHRRPALLLLLPSSRVT